DAAREEKSLLELPVYDGSDKGEKVYNTLTVIGRGIAAQEHPPSDAAADQPSLAGLRRWPVTVSYFDRAGSKSDQPPVYAITFELYENGISRALMLDYNDFAISGSSRPLRSGIRSRVAEGARSNSCSCSTGPPVIKTSKSFF